MAVLRSLCFHVNFRIVFSSSMKKVSVLMVIVINLKVAVGSMVILTKLILLIHECGLICRAIFSVF